MNNMHTETLLVVGGTGFIGACLVEKAVKLGYKTISLSINQPEDRKRIPGVEYFCGDIRSINQITTALKDRNINFAVNLGGYVNHSKLAEGGYELIETHFGGTLNLINCLDLKTLKRFVQIGSSDEYGYNPAPQNENMREAPISSYSFGKTASGHLLEMLSKTENFPATIIRLFLVYGPGQNEQRFLPQIIRGCLKGKTFPASLGDQKRDFCYIDDIVNGIIKAMISETTLGETINLASGKPKKIRDVIIEVRDIIGNGVPQLGKIPYRKGENMELYADISKAKKLINWKPEIDFKTGLVNTIDYYKRSEKNV